MRIAVAQRDDSAFWPLPYGRGSDLGKKEQVNRSVVEEAALGPASSSPEGDTKMR